jgi:2-desacetyl-2-hydroxyethyl bacteriochlorophyllide A dehydrogenase
VSAPRAAVLTAVEQFDMRALDPPAPGRGEVVVRVDECGICGSDLKMWRGTHAFMRPPIVMGHEVYGTVAVVGEGVELEPRRPVTVFPPVGCGECFHCQSGREQLCERMRFFGGQLAGGLATHLVAPASHVLEIPDGVPEPLRVLIEPLSVAVHGVARGAPEPGERVLVIGAGAIGMFTALVLRARGVEDVVIVEPRPLRRERAASLGFATIDPGAGDVREAVSRLIRPEGADCVFECVGSEATIALALACARKGGRAVIVGNAPAELRLDGMTLQRGDRSLIGVLMYDLGDFTVAMRLLEDGLLSGLPIEDVVSRYSLEEAGDAFRDAAGGEFAALKAVLVP